MANMDEPKELVANAYMMKFKFLEVLNYYNHFKYKIRLTLLVFLATQPSTLDNDVVNVYLSRVMNEINQSAVSNIISLNMLFTGYIETIRIIACLISSPLIMVDTFCKRKFVRKSKLSLYETEKLRGEFQKESQVCRILEDLRKFGLEGNKGLTHTLHKLEKGRIRAMNDCTDFALFCISRKLSICHPQLRQIPNEGRIRDAVLLLAAYEQIYQFAMHVKRSLYVQCPRETIYQT